MYLNENYWDTGIAVKQYYSDARERHCSPSRTKKASMSVRTYVRPSTKSSPIRMKFCL